jgi:hypothetical protein
VVGLAVVVPEVEAVLEAAALAAAEEVPAAAEEARAAAGPVGKGNPDEIHGNPGAAHHVASVVRGQEHVARESL